MFENNEFKKTNIEDCSWFYFLQSKCKSYFIRNYKLFRNMKCEIF